MAKNYSELENKVLSFFVEGSSIQYNNENFRVLHSGKPISRKGGEPKTDCYIMLDNENTREIKEYKISCKLASSNEFQENKISALRAYEIFGENWERIIITATSKLRNRFSDLQLNFPNGSGRNKYGHLILGWRLDITTKPRNLSIELPLTDTEFRDIVYKGINQSPEKKDSYVNGIQIIDSGISNCMLVSELNFIDSATDVLNNIIPIDDYPITTHYLAFTGSSYSLNKPKNQYESRSIAVRVEWSYNNGKLIPTIKYDHPLNKNFKTNSMKKLVDDILIDHPDIRDEYVVKD